jgi:cytochrome c556
MFAYRAALTKDQDRMLQAADVLATSCSNCHNKYRPGAIANRCR